MTDQEPLEWHTEKRKISQLKDHPKNPRCIKQEQLKHLKKSFQKFDYVETVVINLDNMIIAGHMRVKILKSQKKKNEEIEVRVPNRMLTPEECDEYLIRSNKNTGDWDWDILANEWETEKLFDWGFTEDELDFKDPDKDLQDENEEEEEVPEPAKDEDAKTKIGDLYELGDHILLCGDSTSLDQINKALGSNNPEMIYTDPPYGIKISISDGKKHGNSKCKRNNFNPILNDDSTDCAVRCISLLLSLVEVKTMIIWGANYYSNVLPPSNCWIIWDKNTGSNDFCDAELAWCNHKSAVRIFKHTWNGMIKESEKGEKRVHPTQKPIALAEWCITKYGSECQIIFDPFLGSGSTLIAAEKLNRKCIGLELSPAYCDVIVERYRKYKASKNELCEIKLNGEIYNG